MIAELIRTISSTPVPIVLIITGVVFIFLAIGGKFGAQIITDNIKRPIAGWLGGLLLGVGIILSLSPFFLSKQPQVAQGEKKAEEKAYLLRCQSDEAGQMYKTVNVFTMPNATMRLHTAGKTVNGTYSLTRTFVTNTEILRRYHGRPVTIREQVLTDVTVTEITVNGKTNKSKVNGPFSGNTLLIEWNDGKWRKNLLGQQPTPLQIEKLNESYVDEQEQYPNQPKQIGDGWELTGSQLALFGGMATARSVRGRAFLKLDDVKDYQQEKCAVVSTRGEIQAIMPFNGQDVKVSFGGYGSSLRSLKHYYDIKSQFTGQLKLESNVEENGRTTGVTISGPYQVESAREKM